MSREVAYIETGTRRALEDAWLTDFFEGEAEAEIKAAEWQETLTGQALKRYG